MSWPTPEESDLAVEVRRILARHAPLDEVRNAAVPGQALHAQAWKHLAGGLGVLGLAVATELGGAGGDVGALAVVAEQIGRAAAAVPFLPGVLCAEVLAAAGCDQVRELAQGGLTGAVAVAPGEVVLDGGHLAGRIPAVVGGADADLLVILGPGPAFFLVPAGTPGLTWRQLRTLDLGRPQASLELLDVVGQPLTVDDPTALQVRLRRLERLLVAAEQCGIAGQALDIAVEHAKVRHQFGSPVGSFQAVKHLLADAFALTERARALLVTAVELMRSAEPGAALDVAVESALVGTTDAASVVTSTCVQVLGGIGFTWEHDAHLYFRRARANAAVVGGRHRVVQALADLLVAGVDLAEPEPPLPPDEVRFAERFRAWVAEHTTERLVARGGDPATQARHVAHAKAYRRALADAGFAGITVPVEYGGAGLTIAHDNVAARAVRGRETFEEVFGIGTGMCVPVLLTLGTPEQKQRYIAPLLRGERIWCQLFSEPDAGSDLAGLRTRAVADDDGWVLNGAKVWTTYAQHADFALLLARTDPAVPKHKGLTMFVVDMHAAGITTRPLRQMTGDCEFNAVFLDDVRLPPDAVVGEINGGWHAATVMLMNERVMIGREPLSMSPPVDFARLRRLVLDAGLGADTAARARLVDVFVLERGLQLLGHKVAAGLRVGTDPGPFASISKLGVAQLARLTTQTAFDLAGPDAAAWPESDSAAGVWSYSVLIGPALGIAGGTDQIQRTIIGERLLGLPR